MPILEPEPPLEPRPRYDEEIRLIARIVERADQSVRPSALLLVLGGAIAATTDLCYYVYYWRYYHIGHAATPQALIDWADCAYLPLLAISAVALLKHRAKTQSTMVDHQLAITFIVAAGIAFVTDMLGYPHWVMAGPDYSMFANGLFAVPMLSIGIQYDCRPLVLGGIALFASLIVPHFDPNNVNLYTGLGMLCGVVVPGVYFAMFRRA
jgi:hypothetical protein